MFYHLRNYYYISRYLKELKSIAEEPFETMKDFRLKAGFYEENLRKAFELTKKMQLKRHNKMTLTYETYLDYLYKDVEMKSMIINNYGIETYNIFLRAGGLNKKPVEEAGTCNEMNTNQVAYAEEIQKHLLDLGCSLTKAGYMAAMALKHDRNPLDQAISFCVGAIAEKYCQIKDLIHSTMEGNTHLLTASQKIKMYYENKLISSHAYQSVTVIFGICLNRNRTNDEQSVLMSIVKQNYLGNEELISINQA